MMALPVLARQGWVEAPVTRSLPGQEGVPAKTYFWDTFTTRKGRFRATFDSLLDQRTAVTGTFVVAKFRYVYAHALEESPHLYPAHDELVVEVLLDCQEHLSGTLATTYLLKGKVLQVDSVQDGEVDLMQTSGPGTVTDLCAFVNEKAQK